jgi:hypothetical protein
MIDHERALTMAAEFVYRAVDASGVRARSRLEALFGLSVAWRAGADVLPWLRAVAESTRRALDHPPQDDPFDPYSCDTKLVLLAHRAMLDCGARQSTTLAGFVTDLAAAIRDLDGVPPRLACEVRLLIALGADPFRRHEPVTAGPLALDGSLLRAGTGEIRRVCNWVTAQTFFGALPVPLGIGAELLDSLPVVLMQKLREYDLMLGSTLLRTVTYLDGGGLDECRHAAQYLHAQQQLDGRFGYYARELTASATLRNADLDLYLPVTVSSLWSLAECCTPHFTLISTTNERPGGTRKSASE